MRGSKTEIESYKLVNLLDREGRDVLMDFRGPFKETVECAPVHAYRTAKKLDSNYESALSEPWELEYSLENDHVSASLTKKYDTVSDFAYANDVPVNPSHTSFVSPIDHIGLEVEITGVMDITPEKFMQIVR